MRHGSVGLRLPPRYRRFLDERQWRPCRALQLDEGYLVGTFRLDFTDPALRDPRRLGEVQGIEDLMDGTLDWFAEFPRHVPLSTLIDPALEDPAADESVVVKSFLVFDAARAACPVDIWDYDGWQLHPLADSLDDFLAGRASRRPCRFPPRFAVR